MPEEYVFSSERELLFFTLFSLKSGLSYDLLGITCGMDSSTAHRSQSMGLRLLERTFSDVGLMPQRSFDSVESWQAYFDGNDDLCLDVSEQRIQRPSDNAVQEANYSGKKAHTVKFLSVCTKHKYIHYISPSYEGSIHDYTLLKELFPPTKSWFTGYKVRVDVGFKGIDKEYSCKAVYIPHKKSKNKELTETQVTENQQLASERICVEHCFAGLKRYRILSDRSRCHDWALYDQILGVCATLWNFNVTCSKSNNYQLNQNNHKNNRKT